jgi:hypothetical protein
LVKDDEFFSRLASLLNDGLLGDDHEIFSDDTQLRQLSAVVDTESDALTVLEKLVDPEKFFRFKAALDQLKRA